MRSVECVKCRVWSVKCGLWSVKRGVWSGVESEECGV